MINLNNDIRDITDSIRFYIMLSMVCRQNENFVGDPDFQLNSFIKELRVNSGLNEERIAKYSQTAINSIPSEFLKIYKIDNISRR